MPEHYPEGEKVYYAKWLCPLVKLSKSATPSGVVECGDIIKYTITATNETDAIGKIVVKDTIPTGAELVSGSVKVNGITGIATDDDLINGIELVVPAATEDNSGNVINGTAKIDFKVKVVGKPGTSIINVAYGKAEGEEEFIPTNSVENKIEKTIKIITKTTNVNGYNIVFVLDTSGSMYKKIDVIENGVEVKKKKIDVAKEVLNDFIDDVDLPESSTENTSSISVINFSTNASLVGNIANTKAEGDELKVAINNLKTSGKTNMTKALKLANTQMKILEKAKSNNKSLVIFISDGEPTLDAENIESATIVLKNGGKREIYTVGFTEDIDVLKNIATDAEHYKTTQDGDSLGEIIKDIIEEISISDPINVQSVNGLVLLNLGIVDEEHPIIIKVNGTALPEITKKPTDETGKVIKKNEKYYLDLTKFEAEDDISITYFSN